MRRRRQICNAFCKDTFWQQCSLATSCGMRSLVSAGASFRRKHCHSVSCREGAPHAADSASAISCDAPVRRSTDSHSMRQDGFDDSWQHGKSRSRILTWLYPTARRNGGWCPYLQYYQVFFLNRDRDDILQLHYGRQSLQSVNLDHISTKCRWYNKKIQLIKNSIVLWHQLTFSMSIREKRQLIHSSHR